MTDRREQISQALAEAVSRLDAVLNGWGFCFVADRVCSSHCGPFASGHYCRGDTRIGISCRDVLDNIYYEHSFVTQRQFSKEIERYTIGHDSLMRTLGHDQDCHLIDTGESPNRVVAREGGDRVDALIHDWELAAPLLSQRCPAFHEVLRRGYRVYLAE